MDCGLEVLRADRPVAGRRIRTATVAALAGAFLLAGCSSAPIAEEGDAPKASDIRALRWLAEDADTVSLLTTAPGACETPAGGLDGSERALGKIAFESPALLGGAAARMGLSCSSCHLNGRGNPAFFIAGVSGAPGTADVTSSLFSKVRGDGTFNPVAIPDIGMKDGTQLGDRKSSAFRAKVRGLVVEEFDGQEPPPQVFDALIAYLDGLDPGACASHAHVRLDPVADLDAASLAFAAATGQGLETDARVFFLRAARARLERIHERYPARDDAGLRAQLVALSRSLAGLAEQLQSGDEALADFAMPRWQDLAAELAKAQPRSLYDPDVLRAALEAG